MWNGKTFPLSPSTEKNLKAVIIKGQTRISYPNSIKCVESVKRSFTLEGSEDKETSWHQGPLKVAFLGAPGVGKTQILQQFFKHDFSETHARTAKPFRYRSCLVCDTMIRELIVLDVPPQKKFPIDNLAEWNHNKNPLGLRSMQVYVLVFDMGNLETFQYCRSIREQILSSFTHRNFSIMVVGNKFDSVVDSPNYSQELKDISALVRKHWRSDYVECSAKHNYKVNDVFREIMGVSGLNGCSGTGVEFSQSSRHKSKKCTIL